MCSSTGPATATLPMTAQAPGLARDLLRSEGCSVHHSAVLEDAIVLLSELVTNAVKYGAAPLRVDIDCDGPAGLRVAVADAGHALPRRTAPGAMAVGGRGLGLVEMLSDGWGVENGDSGKQVWLQIGACKQ